jgi:hypothetical protein
MGGIVGTVVSVGASLLGGRSQSKAATKAADTQADAARYAADLQYKQYKEQQKLQAPFREAGLTAQNRLLDYLGLSEDKKAPGYGTLMRDFSMGDFQQDPGYAFRLSEGTRALERTAAARGGLLSGSTLRGAQRFGQDLASQEYQNAFNRYQVNRGNRLNPLQSLLGSGQSATNVLGTAGQNYATQAGENYMGAANARASGYVGSANALSNAFGGVSNAITNYNLMNTLNRPAYTPSTGGYSSGGGVNAFL